MATAGNSADDRSKSYIPRSSVVRDGWSTEEEATVTCYCGAVQLAVPIKAPGLVNTFLCHCTDCRKITASQYASNFTVLDSHVRNLRGRENLTVWGQAETVGSGGRMTNHFCSTCGTLMYRTGATFPGMRAMRVGTVDDFAVQETALRPQMEIFVAERVRWLSAVPGAVQHQGMMPRRSDGQTTGSKQDIAVAAAGLKSGGRL